MRHNAKKKEIKSDSIADKLIKTATVNLQQICDQSDRSFNRIKEIANNTPALRLVKVAR